MKTNIALIGFMGTGKTAVGKLLARKLDKQFIELDRLIERRAGKSIPEIFEEDGEITFRELEIDTIRDISKNRNSVIACGGGIVLNKINIDRLRESSIIIYLTASPETVLERTSTTKDIRPLLDVPDPALRIRELLEFRKPFYERAADITVNTSRLDTHTVAEQIIKRLKEDEGFNL